MCFMVEVPVIVKKQRLRKFVTIYIGLKKVREARGFSQEKLARTIGVALNTIQRWEYEQIKNVPLDILEKLCETLECNIEDLLVKRLAPTPITPPSQKLLSLLPMPTQLVAVENAIILRAVPSLVERMEELAHKERTVEEEEEFGTYLELDDLISLVNRKIN